MKRTQRAFAPILLVLSLLLTACQTSTPAPAEEGFTVVTTTYPLYLFARTLTAGTEGVNVLRLNTGETSCLHDYTLTVSDMKLLEGADLVVINGVDLEEFMDDALASTSAPVVDCSEGIALLVNPEHEEHHVLEEDDHHDTHAHDHGHFDPHIWMDPLLAAQMVNTLADGLIAADPTQQEIYAANQVSAVDTLANLDADLSLAIANSGLSADQLLLITFHDGFRYLAARHHFTILKSIEEEEGSEASAKEINEIVSLIRDHSLPAIFVEVNSPDATANAIARETGVAVGTLSMLMSGGDDADLSAYVSGIMDNMTTILSAIGG